MTSKVINKRSEEVLIDWRRGRSLSTLPCSAKMRQVGLFALGAVKFENSVGMQRIMVDCHRSCDPRNDVIKIVAGCATQADEGTRYKPK